MKKILFAMICAFAALCVAEAQNVVVDDVAYAAHGFRIPRGFSFSDGEEPNEYVCESSDGKVQISIYKIENAQTGSMLNVDMAKCVEIMMEKCIGDMPETFEIQKKECRESWFSVWSVNTDTKVFCFLRADAYKTGGPIGAFVLYMLRCPEDHRAYAEKVISACFERK